MKNLKSITIHKLEHELYASLGEMAEKQGTSINKLVKKLLRRSLGLETTPRKKRDISFMVGTWTDAEAREFNESIVFFDEVSKPKSNEKD